MGVFDFVRGAGAKVGTGKVTEAKVRAEEDDKVAAAHDEEKKAEGTDSATQAAARAARIAKVQEAKNERIQEARVAAVNERRASDAKAVELEKFVTDLGLGVEGLDIVVTDGVAVVKGTVTSEETRQKVILAVGNVEGIDTVDEELAVVVPPAPEPAAAAPEPAAAAPEPVAPVAAAPAPVHYTVVSGDSLSKIAKQFFGDAGRYPAIFEANRPMLSDPDKIYPGQVLVIPGA